MREQVLPSLIFLEHQFRSYEDLGLSAQHPVVDALERLNERAGCLIFRLERQGLRAQDRVGLVRVGGRTFEILPKIAAPGRPSGRNLLAMLAYAYAFPIQAEAEADLEHAPGGWFELLTRMFAAELHRQMAAGAAQHYVAREERLPVLRGRWNLARQARRPAHERHYFDVSYEEWTADTPLNQIFRWVVEELARLASDRGNWALLAALRERLQAVTLLPEIPPGLPESIRFNRLNERFRPAFTLARLFLAGRVIRLQSGGLPAYAFVFQMEQLFERFLTGFLERHRGSILPPIWQGAEVLAHSAGLRAYLAESEGRGVLRLIPDLLVRRRESDLPLLVADAKYRALEGEIAREDAYQMLAYLVRLGCRRGLLLYPQPEAASGPLRRRWVIASPGLEIFACTLNLYIPLDRPQPLINELAGIFAFAAGSPPASFV